MATTTTVDAVRCAPVACGEGRRSFRTQATNELLRPAPENGAKLHHAAAVTYFSEPVFLFGF